MEQIIPGLFVIFFMILNYIFLLLTVKAIDKFDGDDIKTGIRELVICILGAGISGIAIYYLYTTFFI